MKIERISENQIRLTLTRTDLTERNIRLEDLMNPSEKTQRLFKDIMEHALEEYEFMVDNVPLMVEASPLGNEGMMIVVTRMNNDENNEDDDYNSDVIDKDLFDEGMIDSINNWNDDNYEDVNDENINKDSNDESKLNGKMFIYSFNDLDDVIKVAVFLFKSFRGESSLYKQKNKYFLVLNKSSYLVKNGENILSFILQEYGEKYVSSNLGIYYLKEHADVIIEKNAISKLAETFS